MQKNMSSLAEIKRRPPAPSGRRISRAQLSAGRISTSSVSLAASDRHWMRRLYIGGPRAASDRRRRERDVQCWRHCRETSHYDDERHGRVPSFHQCRRTRIYVYHTVSVMISSGRLLDRRPSRRCITVTRCRGGRPNYPYEIDFLMRSPHTSLSDDFGRCN